MRARSAAGADLPAVFRLRRPRSPVTARSRHAPLRPEDASRVDPASPASVAHACLSLEHVDLAIEVLRRHLDAEPRPLPAAWLMLLDLCRTHGRELAFREAAAEFHRRCNVCAPEWERYPPDNREPGLEAFPRILRELTLAWGTHECRRLLDRLLYDNRSGARGGFTMNAYNDLIMLRRVAGAVLETIERDFAEESKARGACAQVSDDADAEAVDAPPLSASGAPLARELECQLEADLGASGRAPLATD